MAAKKERVVLPGSERKAVAGAKPRSAADPDNVIEVTVRLRSKKSSAKALMSLGAQLPAKRKYVSREDFGEEHGADPDDVAKLDEFAHQHGLSVVRSSLTQSTVRLTGTVGAFSKAFGVKLQNFRGQGEGYRGRTGPIYIPKELKGIIEGIQGLDNRPVAKPHFRMRQSSKGAVAPRNAADGSLAVTDITQLYNFPAGLTGKGQCIALIELNDQDETGKITGTGFKVSDIEAYFKRVKIPAPEVVSVSVDGGANMPGFSDADGEVVLDIEVAGAAAPGAKIAVYFAPNTTQGFIDAVKAAVHDTVHKPSVISISWGGAEDPNGIVSPQFLKGLDEAFQDAATLGVTICCASGDDGSADMREKWDGKPHTDFPSSSPFALACGGTKLIGTGSKITSESVWNRGRKGGAGGGGVSNFFPLPSYQSKSKVPVSPKGKKGRGVPDVAGNADPFTGYQIFLDGSPTSSGGTSAVAPLAAGLIARINERLVAKVGKTAGFINPLIYGDAAPAIRDITDGNNDIEGNLKGTYTAGKGWDACTGLGVADGAKLLKAMGG